MCTFANSEDPDEMHHNAAFHQGLHCWFVCLFCHYVPNQYTVCKGKNKTKVYNMFVNYNLTHLDMYNGLS